VCSSQAAPRSQYSSRQLAGPLLFSSCSNQAAPCRRRPSCHPTHRARPYPYSRTVDLPPWVHPRPSPSVRSASTSCARGGDVSRAALTASITSVAASSIWLHLCPAPSEHHVPVAVMSDRLLRRLPSRQLQLYLSCYALGQHFRCIYLPTPSVRPASTSHDCGHLQLPI
jgi:hypothetical protein